MRSGFCAGHSSSRSSWSCSLCAQELLHPGADLRLLAPVKGNCNVTAHKDMLHKCVSNIVATVWEKAVNVKDEMINR